MTTAHVPPYACTPEELQWAGVQPVFCTLNQSGVWSPVVGVTGGVPWPQPWAIPDVPYRLAFRPPPNAWVMDVDDHDGQGQGPATLAAMEARFGPLPLTWRLSARGGHNPAGRRLYRIPEGVVILDTAFKAFGGHIESVRTGHRFSWAPGDINPKTGTPVECFGPDGNPTTMPPVSHWPELPPAWVSALQAPAAAQKTPLSPTATATEQFMQQEPPQRLSAAMSAVRSKLEEVAAHKPADSGFRLLLERAAYTLGGYAAGAPEHFDRARLEEALEDAVTQVWGSVNAQDALWIEQGLTDGGALPFRVYDETRPPELPDNVVQMPGVQQPVQPAWMPVDRLAELESLLVDADGLRNIPPPSPLVAGWLFKDSLAWLIGDPGEGKTFAAVDLACSVATGRPWQGHPVAQGKVLYLIAEGVSGLSQRVDAWSAYHQTPVHDAVFLPVPVQLFKGNDVEPFASLVAKLQPSLVILDTQARVTVGAVENAAEDIGLFVHNLARVQAAAKCCVLTVHHSPRGGKNPRGSSATEGASDTIVHVSKDGLTVTLEQTRQKDTETRPPLMLELKPSGKSVVLTSQANSVQQTGPSERAMELHHDMLRLGGIWTYSGILQDFGIPRSSASRYLRDLEAVGLVIADRDRLTDTFRARRPETGPLVVQPNHPVDNPPEPVDKPDQTARGQVEYSAQAAQAAHDLLKRKLAGQSGVTTPDHQPDHEEANLTTAHRPLGLGRSWTGKNEQVGKEACSEVPEAPRAPAPPQGPQALPDMPEPAPKKRAEPRPGTKAYERAQAKAAEKAERIALAAGGGVQYPAVVLRDGQVLESPLSTAEELLSGLSELTVDVESSGVPIGHKDYELRLVQLGNDEFAVDLDPKDPAQMELAARVLATAPVLHAHSSTADIVPLAHAGYVDFDSAMVRMDDTAIRAKLNDPQSTGSDAGLKRISDYMLGADSASTPAEEARAELFKANGWLSEPKADTPVERNGWYQVDPACKTFARYGGSDVLDTALIAKRLAQIPPHIAARENAVAHMVSRIALKGIKLNGALIGDLMTEHVMKRDEWAKAIQSWTSIDNVGSDKQVAQALLGMGVRLPYTKPSTRFPDGQPSVAAGVLETLQGELEGTGHPAATLIEQVLTWRHHDTAITLFLTPYSVLVNDGDGRARPTVYTLGADTGRMSCTRPNIQQLPREGGFRAMFVADEGMTFISADFSSVEIRVAAALSQDQVLIRMLEEGLDPHAMAAAIVYGPDFTKAQRYAVKRGVFGRIYGGGVSTLAAQMRVSVAIAQKLIDAIDTLWPTLSAWSKASTQAVERGLETTFTTYAGRVVHLPKKAAHAAGNYKIQGTARELLVDALMRWRETKWGKAIMWPVHDELDAMVPLADAEAATAELVRCMETELYGVRIIAEPSAPSPVWQDAA